METSLFFILGLLACANVIALCLFFNQKYWHFDFKLPKLKRGFEALVDLKTPYYKGVKKEEISGWDTLSVTKRK